MDCATVADVEFDEVIEPPGERRELSRKLSTVRSAPLTFTGRVGGYWTVFGICFFLVAAVWIVFGQTLGFEFVNYDDNSYVYENPEVIQGLSLKGIEWAFTHSVAANWHPLTVMSYMLDCQLYGPRSGGCHLTNLLFHAATAILLFLTLREMTGALWRSAFIAAVFAVHPLRVESVAWVSERKDVLSGLFFVLTLWAYIRYVRSSQSLSRYLMVLFLFALGLMCKPMLVTVPFVLLLLDYWPLNRFETTVSRVPVFWKLILEKVPFIAMSVTVGVVTLLIQQPVKEFPISLRISNALLSYAAYGGQMFLPSGLAIPYPYPIHGLPAAGNQLVVGAVDWHLGGGVLLEAKAPILFDGLVVVLGNVDAGNWFGAGWRSGTRRPLYLPASNRFVHSCDLDGDRADGFLAKPPVDPGRLRTGSPGGLDHLCPCSNCMLAQ